MINRQEEEIIIPRSFQKEGWKLFGMKLHELFLCFVFYLLVVLPVVISYGFTIGTGIVALVMIFVSFMIVFPFGRDKIKFYEFLTRNILNLLIWKTYGTKRNNINNAYPFNDVDDCVVFNRENKIYMSTINIEGINLPLYSELDQRSKIYKLNNLFRNIKSNVQIITLPRKKDYSENVSSLIQTKKELLESYLIEYKIKSNLINKKGELNADWLDNERKIIDLIAKEINKESRKGFKISIDNLNMNINQLKKINQEGDYIPSYFILMVGKNLNNLSSDIEIANYELKNLGLNPRILSNNELWTFSSSYFSNDHKKLNEKIGLEDIMPKKIRFKNSHYIVEFEDRKEYQMIISITALQKYAYRYWLSDLLNDFPDAQIIYRTKEYSAAIATKKLKKTLFAKQGQIFSAKYETTKAQIQRDIDAMNDLIDNMANNAINLQSLSIYIKISASSLRELKFKRNQLRTKIDKKGLDIDHNYLRQWKAFSSSLPTLTYETVDKKRQLVIPSVATWNGFPFTVGSFQDKNAPILGISRDSYQPIMIDLKKRDEDTQRVNSNFNIFGMSGMGKSFFAKKIYKDFVSLGIKSFIIDPQSEYEILARQLGGQVINVNDTNNSVINPLEIIETANTENSSSYIQHMQFLEGFLKHIFSELKEHSLRIIIDIINDIYIKKGFDKKDISKLKSSDFPIFEDVLKSLKIGEKKVAKSPFELKYWIEARMAVNSLVNNAITGRMWNRHTKIKVFDVPLVIFDISELDPKNNKRIAGAQLLIVQKYIDHYIKLNKDKYLNPIEKLSLEKDKLLNTLKPNDKKIIDINNEISKAKKIWDYRWVATVIDEAHLLLDETTKNTVQYIYNQFKTIRKFHGIAGIITQSLTDFDDPVLFKETSGILNACQYSFVFGLKSGDITALDHLLESSDGLTESEKMFLNDALQGEMIVLIGNKRRFIANVSVTDEEKILIEGY